MPRRTVANAATPGDERKRVESKRELGQTVGKKRRAAPPSFTASMAQLKDLQEVQAAFQSSRIKANKRLYKALGAAYHVARGLVGNEQLWLAFCNLPGWKGFRTPPKPKDRTEPLRHVLRFIVGLGKTPSERRRNTKRSSKYFSALTDPFHANVAASDIPKLIRKQGGLDEMATRHSARVQRKPDAVAASRCLTLTGVFDDVARKLSELSVPCLATITVKVIKNRGTRLEVKFLEVARGEKGKRFEPNRRAA